MNVQELYDFLGSLIEEGRSTLQIVAGPPWWQVGRAYLSSETGDALVVALDQGNAPEDEEVDPLDEAVRNATTFRPDL